MRHGFFNITVEISFTTGDEVMDAEDAGDGGGGETEDAQDASQLGEVCRGMAGFDELAGEDTDESDLVDEAFEVDGGSRGEVTIFEAAGIEAMFESIGIADWGAAMAGGRGIGGGGH